MPKLHRGVPRRVEVYKNLCKFINATIAAATGEALYFSRLSVFFIFILLLKRTFSLSFFRVFFPP